MIEITAIITVFTFSTLVCYMIYRLIAKGMDVRKARYMSRGARQEEFQQFKERTEKRLRSLESIVVDDDFDPDKHVLPLGDEEDPEESTVRTRSGGRLPNQLRS